MVSKRSAFSDDIWDLRDELNVTGVPLAHKRLKFDVLVWQNCPDMLLAVKHYLVLRTQGTKQFRPCGWRTAMIDYYLLLIVAREIESRGFRKWSELAVEDWQTVYSESLATQLKGAEICAAIRKMAKIGVPHGPVLDPFATLHTGRLKQVRHQTQPLAEGTLKQIIDSFCKFELSARDIGALLKGTVSRKILRASDAGISSVHEFKRRILDIKIAAASVLLLSTGMRISELLSIKTNALRYDQRSKAWLIDGVVFKAHGKGQKVSWLCGEMGARAVRLAESVLTGDALFAGARGGELVKPNFEKYLQRWAMSENIMEGESPLKIHPHRFRRTFIREMFQPGMPITALKEQLKHKRLSMTDYYVGSDDALIEKLVLAFNAPAVDFQTKLEEEMGL